ncbi:phosphatidylinositol phosphatase PTPRQ-like [Watersipora subatra]|uniref:phosphatidylinositol phosphatase PTPRQ-like n=1 Tax=Watersipora subatra TaxID=2589382 RepID=UPI00355B1BE7
MEAVPAAPTGLSVDNRTSTSVRLTWTPPVLTDADSPITSYQISCKVINNTYYRWDAIDSETSAIAHVSSIPISFLSPQIQYRCYVKANALQGYGEWSSPTIFWTKPTSITWDSFERPTVSDRSVTLTLPTVTSFYPLIGSESILIAVQMSSTISSKLTSSDIETIPGPPTELSVQARDSISVRLNWIPPIWTDPTNPIIEYGISCRAINNTFFPWAVLVPKTSVRTYNSSITLEYLSPQVQYRCYVKAYTLQGYGKKSSRIIVWTKPDRVTWDYFKRPTVSDRSVSLTLPTVTYPSSLSGSESILIAVQLSSTISSKLTSSDIETSDDSYITAELPVSGLSDKFTVGDNIAYGGYVNKPLHMGNYTFYIGLKPVTEEVVDFTSSLNWQIKIEIEWSFSEEQVVNDQLVNLTLPKVTYPYSLSGYESLLIAAQAPSNISSKLTSSDIETCDDSYITAELPVSRLSDKFTVGDNNTYGGYVNRPLHIGNYTFYIGLKPVTEKVVDFTSSPNWQVEIVSTEPVIAPVTLRSSDSVLLEWTKPDRLKNNSYVIAYEISCFIRNSTYNPAASSASPYLTENTLSANVTSLSSQVQYSCQVRAHLSNGYGQWSKYTVFWTKPSAIKWSFSKKEPVVIDTLVTLTLPTPLNLQSPEGYEILLIAVQTNSRVKRELSSADIETSNGSYITAELPVSRLSDKFTVGDNKMYGGYLNRPLHMGDYTFYIGLKPVTEEVVDFTSSPYWQVELLKVRQKVEVQVSLEE